MRRMFGFLVPRTRSTAKSAGCVHHCVAATRTSGQVSATASVSDGTSDTTRRGGVRTSTEVPRSSRGNAADGLFPATYTSL